MSDLLFVVARTQPQLYAHLASAVAGSGIAVIVDRRWRERRGASRPRVPERRRADRRRLPHDVARFYPLGFVVVRAASAPSWLGRLIAAR